MGRVLAVFQAFRAANLRFDKSANFKACLSKLKFWESLAGNAKIPAAGERARD
jgi:hypothetical protein